MIFMKSTELILGFFNFNYTLKESSIEVYQHAINRFVDNLDKSKLSLSDINESIYDSYIIYLRKQGFSDSTILKESSIVKNFIKYLKLKKVISSFNSNIIISTNFKKKEKTYLFNETHLTTVMNDIDKIITDEYSSSLMKTAINLLFTTGLRIGDLHNIKTRQINFDRKIIKNVKIKKNNSIINVKLTEEMSLQLREFYEKYQLSSYEYMISYENGNRIPKSSFYTIFNTVMKNSNLEFDSDSVNIVPHDMRHSFITRQHETGKSIKEIMIMTGSRDYDTLVSYIHPDLSKQDINLFDL